VTRPIHDRMPVILRDADTEAWLDPQRDPEFLRGLLVPYAAVPTTDAIAGRSRSERQLALAAAVPPGFEADLVAEPVSAYVNNPRNDGPQCVAVQRTLL